MSQFANTTTTRSATRPSLHLPPVRADFVAALLGVAVLAAVVLAVTLGGKTADTPAGSVENQAILHSGAGARQSASAESTAAQPASGPNEAAVAASIAPSPSAVTSGPNEAAVAASIAPSPSVASSRPDESQTATSLSGNR